MIAARAWLAAPALLAVVQLSIPARAPATALQVAICGELNGPTVPIRLPAKPGGSDNAAGCKICHSAMRKRFGGSSSCDGEDASDAA